MKDNRLSLLWAVTLAFGCSAGVSGKTGSGGSSSTGTGGTGGSTASGGHGGKLLDRRLQRHRRQLLDRRCQRRRRQPGRRLRRLHRRRPAGPARSLLRDGQLEVDERPDRRRDDEVGGGQLRAQHLLHRLGFRRPRGGAQVLPRRAEWGQGKLRHGHGDHGLWQLWALRLPRHLCRQQCVDDRGVASLPHERRLRHPELCAHPAVRDQQLLRGQRNGELAARAAATSRATATCATSAPLPNTPPRTWRSGRSPGRPAG